MKKFLFAVMIPATCMLFSCGDNSSNKDNSANDSTAIDSSNSGSGTSTDPGRMSSNTGDTMNRQAMGKRTVDDKDVVDFVHKASSGSMMEVQMGNMARDMAKSQRVKDYGTMLVTDHSKAADELKGMATNDNIQVSTDLMPDHKMEMDKLMNMKGNGFDKAYIDMMIKDHNKDIAAFKKASMGLKDDAYKSFAAKTLPVLQKHLDSAMAIHKSM